MRDHKASNGTSQALIALFVSVIKPGPIRQMLAEVFACRQTTW